MTLFARSIGRGEQPAGEAAGLLKGYSIEITAKDGKGLEEAAPLLVPGTSVSVTFLPGEEVDARVAAAAKVRQLGFRPVSHVSARRLKSEAELKGFLSRLKNEAGIDSAFVVAGDPPQPEGPYEDALAIIRTGLLAEHGIRRVGISGYPEGHPDISEEKLWAAVKEKHRILGGLGHECEITTQFGFDAEPVFTWLERLREEGVDSNVRIGVAGPASVKTLLRFAARCGVGASAKVMSKYGLSITKLLNTAGPDPIIHDLAAGLDPKVHGSVTLHFYPFGGVKATAEWIRNFAAQHG
ncbi:methylenetetrahydrofolate reductase [Chelativorans sp.]|uniref:methylenetetrahydrofolate reductase n=1 Tax=Chelativorans sp. TaxID=2203393 RepID=UPI0028123CD4|nr:methylenetetrahydrofolate reductase [Chelativorans sp.]